MKIDVEGAEARAVLGGIKFLELFDVAVIQMELLWFSMKMIDMETVELFLKEMHRLRYKAYLAKVNAAEVKLTIADIERWPLDVFWFKSRHL